MAVLRTILNVHVASIWRTCLIITAPDAHHKINFLQCAMLANQRQEVTIIVATRLENTIFIACTGIQVDPFCSHVSRRTQAIRSLVNKCKY